MSWSNHSFRGLALGLAFLLGAPAAAEARGGRVGIGDRFDRPRDDEPAEELTGNDADVVLLIPAEDEVARAALEGEVQPWIDHREDQGYSVETVALYSIAAEAGVASAWDLEAEHIRGYLADHFSARKAGDSTMGRYLGLMSVHQDSADVSPEFPPIPRYELWLEVYDDSQYPDLEGVTTDLPFGFITAADFEADDGVTRPEDFDTTDPEFLVFRVPVSESGDLARFASRSIEYEAAAYRADLTLVAGQITHEVPGDSSMIQCVNQWTVQNAGAVHKVFDSTVCNPDSVTSVAGDQRLADYMAAGSTPFGGGVVYNISHGNMDGVYIADGLSLGRDDVAGLDPDELTIFISLACSNDQPWSYRHNFARTMYDHSAVAVAASTVNTIYGGAVDLAIGELRPMDQLFDHGNTLGQAMQRVKATYFDVAVTHGIDEHESQTLFVNVVAVNLTGDALLSVAD